MRNKRHEAILDLIKEQSIETQQELTDSLSQIGFEWNKRKGCFVRRYKR